MDKAQGSELLALVERIEVVDAYDAGSLGSPGIYRCDDSEKKPDDARVILIDHRWRDTIAKALRSLASAPEPVAWIKHLSGKDCKPDGRCYDIVFGNPNDSEYKPLVYAST